MRWSDATARAYGSLGEQGHEGILRELLAGIGPRISGRKVLDFGCGPGRLTLALGEAGASRVVAVDQSPEMVAVARASTRAVPFAGRIRFVVGDERCVGPAGGFGVALCSLALMMCGSRRKLHRVCRSLVGTLAPGGLLLAVVTHPCFRTRDYGTFHYEVAEDYDYWQLGEPYRVVLTPADAEEPVVITDVHWTLEAYVEAMVGGGGVLAGLRELPARRTADGAPVGPPAYLAMMVRRRETGEGRRKTPEGEGKTQDARRKKRDFRSRSAEA